jgi:hypothetical protein
MTHATTEASPSPPEPVTGRPDPPGVEAFLVHLARCLQRHRAYPSTNPLCAEANTTCHRALVSLQGREQVAIRVTPRALMVDDHAADSHPVVVTELRRRLHRCGIARLTIDRGASPSHLSRFCRELLRRDAPGGVPEPLADALLAGGIDSIQVVALHRPEVLNVGAPSAGQVELLDREKQRRDRSVVSGDARRLYPAGRGWVRVDPTCPVGTVTLTDLALLVDDPMTLAGMLVQLSDGATDTDRTDALEEKFEEIAKLVGSLSPRLAEQLFGRLAHSVLALEPERRQRLLRDTILPRLLDGRIDGAILRQFPDLELADAMVLLLDLQVAAPELMSTLDRLQLEPGRRERLHPLIEARRRGTSVGDDKGDALAAFADSLAPGMIDGYDNGRIRVDHSLGKDFQGFVTHDLAMNGAAESALADLTALVAATDPAIEEIRCAHNLLKVETNPDIAAGLLQRATSLLSAVAEREDWHCLAEWVAAWRRTADALRQDRPEIAELVDPAMSSLATTSLMSSLASGLEKGPEGRPLAESLLDAFGAAAAPALVSFFEEEPSHLRRQALLPILTVRAPALAPALADRLHHPQPSVVRYLVLVLGYAGPGTEAALAGQVEHRDERVAREAYRALARIGSPAALTIVTRGLESAARGRESAEDAFWRFPVARAAHQAGALLSRTDFVTAHPELALRLLEKLAERRSTELGFACAALKPLRYHVWRPALMRLGQRAVALGSQA